MKKRKLLRYVMAVALCLMLPWAVASVHASGFAIMEQSVRSLGTAFSGAAVQAEDASTIYFNPAGLTRLSGNNGEVGLHYILPKYEFTNKGSTTVLGTALTGGNGGNGGEAALVPNLYYAHSLTPDLKLGIGINAPYGLTTEYDKTWVGRYQAVKSELLTININPSVAYRINSQWSVGLGLSAQKADAELSNSVDFGTAFAAYGTIPQGADGFAKMTGDDWGYGVNLGIMFEPQATTRIGLAYRSMVSHTIKGKVKYEYPNATVPGLGGITVAQAAAASNFVNGDAHADINLPETVSLAAYHELNDKLALLADITWTKWSRLEALKIKFDSGQADSVTTLDWDDTWRYGIGLIYKATDKITGRFGLAYDQSPVPDAHRRTPRVPDENRIWAALGAGFKITPQAELNVGYVHIFFTDDPKIEKTATGEDTLRGALRGTYDASGDIVSVNFNLAF